MRVHVLPWGYVHAPYKRVYPESSVLYTVGNLVDTFLKQCQETIQLDPYIVITCRYKTCTCMCQQHLLMYCTESFGYSSVLPVKQIIHSYNHWILNVLMWVLCECCKLLQWVSQLYLSQFGHYCPIYSYWISIHSSHACENIPLGRNVENIVYHCLSWYFLWIHDVVKINFSTLE